MTTKGITNMAMQKSTNAKVMTRTPGGEALRFFVLQKATWTNKFPRTEAIAVKITTTTRTWMAAVGAASALVALLAFANV